MSASGRFKHIHRFGLLARRFALTVLVLATFGLMLLGKADNLIVGASVSLISDLLTPVLTHLSKPANRLAEGIENIKELSRIREENARLREDNSRLRLWQAIARHQESENRQLTALLNFMPLPDSRFVSGRVVGDTGGAFAHSLIVNLGADQNVAKGQAVMTGEGLVGRITLAGTRSSRILLISDINARIPVQVESSRVRAILAGDNTEHPKLIFIPHNTQIAPGERIVTSGHAGAFPPGLPIGMTFEDEDGQIRVRPFVDRNKLEYVRVINYNLTGILTPEQTQCRAE